MLADMEELEELPIRQKTRKRVVEFHQTSRTAYFRNKSCAKKMRFRNLEEAKDFIQMVSGKLQGTARKFNELRAYRCPICNGIHTAKKHVRYEDQERIAPVPEP